MRFSPSKPELVAIYLVSMASIRFALSFRWSTFSNSINLSRSKRVFFSDTSDSSTSTSKSSPDEIKSLLAVIQAHQSTAAKPTKAEAAKTLVAQSIGYGVLSTNSVHLSGFPTGSVVPFALNEQGKPVFAFSTLSSHTTDLLKDGRASLTIMEKNFKNAENGRVSILGIIKKVSEDNEIKTLREIFLKRHPDAFWIDFGDFSFFQMETIETLRYVGGFADAGTITGGEYLAAQVDPVAGFAEPVIKHMNEDHSDSTITMVKHYVGIPCKEAQITSLDRLGITVKASFEFLNGETMKLRLPFPRAVTGRKEVKEVLVEMTRAAATV